MSPFWADIPDRNEQDQARDQNDSHSNGSLCSKLQIAELKLFQYLHNCITLPFI